MTSEVEGRDSATAATDAAGETANAAAARGATDAATDAAAAGGTVDAPAATTGSAAADESMMAAGENTATAGDAAAIGSTPGGAAADESTAGGAAADESAAAASANVATTAETALTATTTEAAVAATEPLDTPPPPDGARIRNSLEAIKTAVVWLVVIQILTILSPLLRVSLKWALVVGLFLSVSSLAVAVVAYLKARDAQRGLPE